MESAIKIIGFVLIMCASSLTGALKSYQLTYRFKKLGNIYRSISDLKERIRLNGGEISRLVKESFNGNLIEIVDNEFKINESGLSSQDIDILNEFFSNIGMSDIQSECDRTELFMTLVFKQCGAAEKKCNELCKLYNTLGFLCGVFICIFLL